MTLIELIRETLALEPSTPIQETDGPGSFEAWDSLGHLRLLSAVQKAYRVELSPEELGDAVTVGRLRALLRRKGVPE